MDCKHTPTHEQSIAHLNTTDMPTIVRHWADFYAGKACVPGYKDNFLGASDNPLVTQKDASLFKYLTEQFGIICFDSQVHSQPHNQRGYIEGFIPNMYRYAITDLNRISGLIGFTFTIRPHPILHNMYVTYDAKDEKCNKHLCGTPYTNAGGSAAMAHQVFTEYPERMQRAMLEHQYFGFTIIDTKMPRNRYFLMEAFLDALHHPPRPTQKTKIPPPKPPKKKSIKYIDCDNDQVFDASIRTLAEQKTPQGILEQWALFYENKACIPTYQDNFLGGADNSSSTIVDAKYFTILTRQFGILSIGSQTHSISENQRGFIEGFIPRKLTRAITDLNRFSGLVGYSFDIEEREYFYNMYATFDPNKSEKCPKNHLCGDPYTDLAGFIGGALHAAQQLPHNIQEFMRANNYVAFQIIDTIFPRNRYFLMKTFIKCLTANQA